MDLSEPPRRQRGESIVPMINVVFLLLVFFLMTSQLTAPEPFEVRPPQAATQTQAEAEPVLFVSRDGRIVFDGEEGARDRRSGPAAAKRQRRPAACGLPARGQRARRDPARPVRSGPFARRAGGDAQMRHIAEPVAFASLAILVHVVLFAQTSEHGIEAGGSGGVALMSLEAADATVAEMVEAWDRAPQAAVPAPRPEPAPTQESLAVTLPRIELAEGTRAEIRMATLPPAEAQIRRPDPPEPVQPEPRRPRSEPPPPQTLAPASSPRPPRRATPPPRTCQRPRARPTRPLRVGQPSGPRVPAAAATPGIPRARRPPRSTGAGKRRRRPSGGPGSGPGSSAPSVTRAARRGLVRSPSRSRSGAAASCLASASRGPREAPPWTAQRWTPFGARAVFRPRPPSRRRMPTCSRWPFC